MGRERGVGDGRCEDVSGVLVLLGGEEGDVPGFRSAWDGYFLHWIAVLSILTGSAYSSRRIPNKSQDSFQGEN
jgi:hypothetical protein